ncbi:ABC transporter permease [bacterium]|nr:ABC transporter permease [candidate division CSSED10-310 bacterium]
MSLLFKIAWRNVWRHPRRSILTMAAIAFAAAIQVVMMGIQTGSYGQMIDNAVKIHTGHLQLQHPGYLEDRKMTQVLRDRDGLQALLESRERVVAVAARVNAPALVSAASNTFGGMLMGVEPRAEAAVSTIAAKVRDGRYLDDADPYGALVGATLARNLGVAVGDEIVFMGQGADGALAANLLTVRGTFTSGFSQLDKSGVYLPLATAQEEFALHGAVHEMVAMVDDFKYIWAVRNTLNEAIREQGIADVTALSWDQITPEIKEAIQLDAISAYIFFLVLLLIVAFGILNTILMAFFERIREFGVMLAMGATRRQLQRLIYIETMLLVFVAVAAGAVLGSTGSLLIQHYGIHFSGTDELMEQWGMSSTVYARYSILHVMIASLTVVLISSITTLSPIMKIGRINPVRALRHI